MIIYIYIYYIICICSAKLYKKRTGYIFVCVFSPPSYVRSFISYIAPCIIFGNQQPVCACVCFCTYFLYLTYKLTETPICTCSNRGFETDHSMRMGRFVSSAQEFLTASSLTVMADHHDPIQDCPELVYTQSSNFTWGNDDDHHFITFWGAPF